jgi:hypothetical protein
MRKLYFTFLSVFLISCSCFAQSLKKNTLKFEIGVEGGLTSDYLKVRDEAGNLQRGKNLLSGTGGPKIRLYLNDKFFLEAAFMFKENSFGYTFKQHPESRGSGGSGGSEIFFIPIKAGYEYKLSKKVAFNIFVGLAPGLITLNSGSSGYGKLDPGNINFTYQMRDKYKKNYLTLTSGVSLSHLIAKRFKCSAGANLYAGVSDVEIYDFEYSINGGPVQFASIANRGSFINYNVGLSYLLKQRSAKK